MKKVIGSMALIVGLATSANAGVHVPDGKWSGAGEMVAQQTSVLPYKLLVSIKTANGVSTWTQTFNFANGQSTTNVFVATSNETTGFLKISTVNGVAQTNSGGYCAKDSFTDDAIKCTFRWQQNGEGQEDTATFHKNGTLAQFASDELLDLVWHDVSKPSSN